MASDGAKIDITHLLQTLKDHILGCPSAEIVLDSIAAFESWFLVELAHVLRTSFLLDVDTSYTYPCSKCKADLVAGGTEQVVFELKCFVARQDAQKKQRFPEQLAMLKATVGTGHALQGMAIVTFVGYSTEVTQKRFDSLFPPTEWAHRKLDRFEGHLLWIGIAST